MSAVVQVFFFFSNLHIAWFDRIDKAKLILIVEKLTKTRETSSWWYCSSNFTSFIHSFVCFYQKNPQQFRGWLDVGLPGVVQEFGIVELPVVSLPTVPRQGRGRRRGRRRRVAAHRLVVGGPLPGSCQKVVFLQSGGAGGAPRGEIVVVVEGEALGLCALAAEAVGHLPLVVVVVGVPKDDGKVVWGKTLWENKRTKAIYFVRPSGGSPPWPLELDAAPSADPFLQHSRNGSSSVLLFISGRGPLLARR